MIFVKKRILSREICLALNDLGIQSNFIVGHHNIVSNNPKIFKSNEIVYDINEDFDYEEEIQVP